MRSDLRRVAISIVDPPWENEEGKAPFVVGCAVVQRPIFGPPGQARWDRHLQGEDGGADSAEVLL